MISLKFKKGLWIVIKTKKVSEIIINREESWQDNIFLTFDPLPEAKSAIFMRKFVEI